ALTVLVPPAQAERVHRAGLRLRTHQRRVTGTVGLAEGVASRDESDRLLAAHRHPPERHLDVVRRRDRVWLALGALRVDVDQAHRDGTEGAALEVEQLLAPVALVAQPGVLRTPEGLLRLPDVLTAEGEAEGLEADVLVRDVAGEHEQVRPGERAAVLLLDRQQ